MVDSITYFPSILIPMEDDSTSISTSSSRSSSLHKLYSYLMGVNLQKQEISNFNTWVRTKHQPKVFEACQAYLNKCYLD